MKPTTRITRNATWKRSSSCLGSLAFTLGLIAAVVASSPVCGQVIVANGRDNNLEIMEGRITTYERTGEGNLIPQRVIEGEATGLDNPAAVAVDATNHELFVLNDANLMLFGSVTVYDLNDEGDVAPKRTLRWTRGLEYPLGIAVDPIHDELYVYDIYSNLLVFDRAASGDVTEIRALHSLPDWSNRGIALDLAHDEIFVQGEREILVFSRTASGFDEPIRRISGSNTGMPDPFRLELDTAHDEVIVAGEGSIRAFSRSGDGNISPLRVIEGPQTGLSGSWAFGVALDPSSEMVVVSNRTPDTLLFFPRDANGDVPPVRAINGEATQLHRPRGLAVSPVVFVDGFSGGDMSAWVDIGP